MASDQEEGGGGLFTRLGRGLSNMVFTEAPPPDDGEDAALEATLRAPVAVVGSEEEGEDVREDGTGAIGDDFPSFYTRAGVQADPNADALLDAFGDMADMEEAPRRKAMSAMVKGMRADAARVCTTLTQRAKVLDAVVRMQEREGAKRREARHTTLETAATANAGRIEVLRAEIA